MSWGPRETGASRCGKAGEPERCGNHCPRAKGLVRPQLPVVPHVDGTARDVGAEPEERSGSRWSSQVSTCCCAGAQFGRVNTTLSSKIHPAGFSALLPPHPISLPHLNSLPSAQTPPSLPRCGCPSQAGIRASHLTFRQSTLPPSPADIRALDADVVSDYQHRVRLIFPFLHSLSGSLGGISRAGSCALLPPGAGQGAGRAEPGSGHCLCPVPASRTEPAAAVTLCVTQELIPNPLLAPSVGGAGREPRLPRFAQVMSTGASDGTEQQSSPGPTGSVVPEGAQLFRAVSGAGCQISSHAGLGDESPHSCHGCESGPVAQRCRVWDLRDFT